VEGKSAVVVKDCVKAYSMCSDSLSKSTGIPKIAEVVQGRFLLLAGSRQVPKVEYNFCGKVDLHYLII